jgi:elongation factor Ts
MGISAKLVMELRAKTGAGMMDCKKALVEKNGDLEAAIVYLREKGISKAAKKASRITSEGSVFVLISDDNKTGVMIEFNSETDFVTKNDEFNNFGENLTKIVLENEVNSVEDLKAIKMAGGASVEETLQTLIAKIGENMSIRRFKKVVSSGFVCSYLHMGGNIGVILALDGEFNDENLVKATDIAMHSAAMAPNYFDKSEVTEEEMAKEREILRNQLIEQGKPEKIIDNILIGKMNKFFEENCLLQQKFVKDDKKTVAEYAGSLKIISADRFKVGDGIEKKEENFAEEVAAQMKG